MSSSQPDFVAYEYQVMHAITTIRPKTGAENEVLGIGAHEPLGLKLRKGARGHMHWGPNVWMQCYFGSGEAVSYVINSTPWRFFVSDS